MWVTGGLEPCSQCRRRLARFKRGTAAILNRQAFRFSSTTQITKCSPTSATKQQSFTHDRQSVLWLWRRGPCQWLQTTSAYRKYFTSAAGALKRGSLRLLKQFPVSVTVAPKCEPCCRPRKSPHFLPEMNHPKKKSFNKIHKEKAEVGQWCWNAWGVEQAANQNNVSFENSNGLKTDYNWWVVSGWSAWSEGLNIAAEARHRGEGWTANCCSLPS